MYPILLNIGFLKIYSYGFCIALGLLISIYLLLKKASKYNYHKFFLENFIFWLCIVGFLGARIFFVLLNFKYFSKNLPEIFAVWQGGFIFFGGFISAIIFGLFFLKSKRINSLNLLDIFVPYLSLAHFFGRIGCFMAGCCHGKETNCFLGVVYSNKVSLAPLGIKLYPVQLFEAGFNLILFFILLKTLKTRNFLGQNFLIYIFSYSIWRFFIEFLRGDIRGNLYILSISQIISIILFFIGVITWILIRKKK